MADELLDLSNSKLTLDGNEEEQKEFNDQLNSYIQDLSVDRADRKTIYEKRQDFYRGNQGVYSNVTGMIKDTKNKKGHVNQIVNYAGKTTVKIAYGLANNPPKITVPPLDAKDTVETARAQGVQDFQDDTFKKNKFWKKTYRRACFNQAELGDAAIRTFPVKDEKRIQMSIHDDMSTIMVGWNGYDPEDFDFVIAELSLTPEKIKEDFGIVVNPLLLSSKLESNSSKGSWSGTSTQNNWSTNTNSGTNTAPSGKNDLPKLSVIEFDSADVYALQINGELVQYAKKDDVTFPRVKFWTIVHNIPNPPSSWSIADIDYLIDSQIELNDNDNRTADYLRVGGVQRYVAYNMSDFDPESLKTSSGQVIFVNDPDGKSRFEPLPTNVNSFPSDQYSARKLQHIYDMGLPKVNYGASGADSGRSKAIDYQSSVETTIFKRDAWELALADICEKIQIFGNFIFGDVYNWFQNGNGEFVVRDVEFDWNDALPITQSDKIVNIANKVNMIGIPLVQAYKELGYRNPVALLEQKKQELANPDIMVITSKRWGMSSGLLQKQNEAAMTAQSLNPPTETPTNTPTLTTEQNSGNSQPMAGAGSTASYSSPAGNVSRMAQNQAAGNK
jgi:hypothetical protein